MWLDLLQGDSTFRLSFDTFSVSLSWCAATEPLLFRALRWNFPKSSFWGATMGTRLSPPLLQPSVLLLSYGFFRGDFEVTKTCSVLDTSDETVRAKSSDSSEDGSSPGSVWPPGLSYMTTDVARDTENPWLFFQPRPCSRSPRLRFKQLSKRGVGIDFGDHFALLFPPYPPC